jgi:predicted GNAT family acetyltransferase
MIYTPRNRRGRGFASALTSALVMEARKRDKEYCCLYSEFRSSIRPNMYERIGFRLAGEFSERAFAV